MLELDLQGKVALITGGSDGLGRAAAARLAAEGARVAICARRDPHLEAAAAALRAQTGGEVLAVTADVARADDCRRFVDQAAHAFGGVDILLNNAGTSAAHGLEEVDDAAWQADIDLKLMAAVRLCRAAIPIMRARGGGAIVNTPSSAARAAGSARAADLGHARRRDQSHQIARDRVRPRQHPREHDLPRADQERPMGASRPRASVAELYAEMGKRVPLGRMGEAEEYADLVAFLVSPRAAFITGTAINLDGGMGATV